MQITGTQTIPAPPQTVWDALNDPAVLQRCLPGCEAVERIAADTFRVVMKAAVGPLRARFNGQLQLTDAQPPSACVMVFEGQGGAVGFGKGTSSITLTPNADGTELCYTAEAQVGGKLAQVGSRLISGVARKMSDDFFEALRRQLGGAPEPAATASPSVAAPPSTATPPSAPAAPTAPASAAAAAPATALPAAVASALPAVRAAAPAGPWTVPGWWLGIAVVLGSATTLAGALMLH